MSLDLHFRALFIKLDRFKITQLSIWGFEERSSFIIRPYIKFTFEMGTSDNKTFYFSNLGPYSQHFIFFVTHQWPQLVRVFKTGKHYQPGVM